jgi:muramidase (phage lysozyme)
MAVTSPINLDKVSGGVKSLNTGLGQLKKSADTIKTVSLDKIRIKRESISRNKMISNMREEAVKRRDQESIIEASGVGGAFKRVGSVIGNSTKGFVDRLLDFTSSILTGWLLYNLPTILTGIEDLIIRIRSLYGMLTDFVSNITDTFQNFGNLLSAVYQDITQFDFMDHSRRVQNALDDLGSNLDSMHDQFVDGFDLLKTPLGEGPGEQPVPAVNTDYTQPAPTNGTPGPSEGVPSSGYGTKEEQALLKTIRFAEGTAGSTGYSMFFGDKSGQAKYGDLTKLSANEVEKLVTKFLQDPQSRYGKDRSAAVGAYQIIGITKKARALGMDMNRKFDQKFQDEMALLLAASRGVSAEILKREGLSDAVIKKLSPEWASFPGNTYGQPTKRTSDLKATYQASLSSPTKPTQVSPQPLPVKGGNVIEYLTGDRKHKRYRADHAAGNYHDHFAFTNRATRDAAMKWLRSRGWTIGSINTGKHADGSYHYSNQAFDIPFYDGGNYRKKGVTDDAKGETKFSSMVRADLIAGGFSGPQLGGSPISSPANKPAQVSPANKPAQVSPRLFQSQASTSQPEQAQVSSITKPGQNTPPITQNRRGPQIMFVDNTEPSAPQQVSSQGGGSQIQMMPIEDSLNSLIKNQILLELAYT